MNERDQYERADKALDALAERHAAEVKRLTDALAEANDRAEGLWVRHDTAQAELTRLRASHEALRDALESIRRFPTIAAPTQWRDCMLYISRTCEAALRGDAPPQNPPQVERSATGKDELNVCPVCGKNHWCCDGREV